MVVRKKIILSLDDSDKSTIIATYSSGLIKRTGRAKVVDMNVFLEKEQEHESDSDSKENFTLDKNIKKIKTKTYNVNVISLASSDLTATAALTPTDKKLPLEDYKAFFGYKGKEVVSEGIMLEMDKYYPFPMKQSQSHSTDSNTNELKPAENRNLLFLKSDDRKYQNEGVDEIVKSFQEGNRWYLYLVMDSTDTLMKSNSCTKYSHPLRYLSRGFTMAAFKDGYFEEKDFEERQKRCEYTLSDTFDYPEAIIPSNFKLKLRDYQSRSVSWMRSVEDVELTDSNRINNNIAVEDYGGIKSSLDMTPVKIKLGDSGCYFNMMDNKVTRSSSTSPVKPFRVRGGILADDTGSGKTITCLALIHSAPLTTELAKWRLESLNISIANYIPSRASCIICPSNLYDQWISEAKRCDPNFKIIGLSCMRDYEKVSWRDVMMADILVISYQFLTNTNYSKLAKSRCESSYDVATRLDEILDVRGDVDLSYIHFYRVFFDEMHEMGYKAAKCRTMAAGFKADFCWGITGTPPKFIKPTENSSKWNKWTDLEELLPYLNLSKEEVECLSSNMLAREEFIGKFVKRNVPDLKLPELCTEIVWVTATATELAIMNVMTDSRDERDRIMMCCHYQICDKITNIAGVGVNFKSIDEVKRLILNATLGDLAYIKKDLDERVLSMNELELIRDLETSGETDKLRIIQRIENLKDRIAEITKTYKLCESKCKYFKSVFELMESDTAEAQESNECLICYEQIHLDAKTILPCAHIYCFACISEAVKKVPFCPLCKIKLNGRNEILRIRPATTVPKIKKNGVDSSGVGGVVDTSKYGSKLIALYTYVTELLQNDPDARIILFLQYRVLTEFISKTLNELNIKHVRVAGNVFQRNNSIESFKNSADNRIIILSSEDSVSGINLTEATHVVLLHPFWTGKGEDVDLAFEKQGICRAYRGGLDHTLKVVRFAVRNTIDEEISLRRQPT